MLVDSPEMAAALRRDPHVHKTIDMFDRLTKAVVGIGAWTASGSTVRAALPEVIAAELDAAVVDGRTLLAALAEHNGKIYVIGGRVGSVFMSTGSNTDIVEEYDPATDQWGGIRAPMPTPSRAGRGCP